MSSRQAVRRAVAVIASAAGVIAATHGAANAQAPTGPGHAYPAKAIRIIVPFAPGGPNDILGRIVAQKFTEAWGQQAIVENRAGAGTIIGTDLVAKSPPDGYTLLIASTSTATTPSLVKKLPYDTLRDLAPVVLMAASPNLLVVHPSLPARSVRELIAVAKTRPGEVAFGSGGNGTSTHLAGEILRVRSGAKMVHVPYKGAGPSTVGVLSGEVSWMFGSILPLMPYLKAGRLRALGVSSLTRASVLPAVPTIAETLPGFEASPWHGVAAPAGTPREIVIKLNQEIAKILRAPDVRSRMAEEGTEILTGTPEQFGAFMKADLEKWAKVIRDAGIQAQ
jgi:tripartite-type tricarboxylate transporter receptor subunit TctC